MDVYPVLVSFSIIISFLLSSSAAIDTLSANQRIQDGNTIVSSGEMYELGFFSPVMSKNRYLGIWYKKISSGTVVWVANREKPISDASGVFEVSGEGNLRIFSGSSTLIWSSNSTVSVGNINPVIQLLENGNLVMWDESSSKENPIWQSFDYPGNTLLPGMKFGKDLITGKERYLTSWKSLDDPSRGMYKHYLDTNGYPQIFKEKGRVKHSRHGPWNGLGFSGFPMENTNPIYSVEFVVNEMEIYYRYKLKSSVVQRIILMWDGIILQLNWNERTQEWVMYRSIVLDYCSRYGPCGPYGSCRPKGNSPCSCMDGFEPKVPEEWHGGDWSSGCQRKKPLDCGTLQDGFQKISGVKLPDTRRSWYNMSISLVECKMACIRNCSCTAYADLDIRNGGSGCLLWFDELMDTSECEDDHQKLYVRMATSELPELLYSLTEGKSSINRERRISIMAVSLLSTAVLLSAVVAYACRKKCKRLYKNRQGNLAHILDKDHNSVQMENLDELTSISLHKIIMATDNFSIDNKIGEGGYGPVYRGVLEDGQVIAVKRLSETSNQGIHEFRNEVICIAKLQHRNLVKLLGYCIHGKEKILVYEYMENKSLDSFIFNETTSSTFDWPQRFRIIHGLARGILYLHQDSRLQIIHRDLKRGNILLDREMNPKISDFGLARKFDGQDALEKTKKVVGTYGYISPEYAVHGRLSIKSDVFSFGVIVLEIVSGKKNRGFSHEGHSDTLLGHAYRLYKEDKSIELTSTSLRNSYVVSEVLRAIHVGLLCVQHHAADRPTMLSVVLMLISDGELPPPKQPAFFLGESSHKVHPVVSLLEQYMITLVHAR